MHNRTCPTCGETKGIEDFPKASNHDIKKILGHALRKRQCKVCVYAKVKALREEIRLLPKNIPDKKWCSDCLKTKPNSEFYTAPTVRDGLSYMCKDCTTYKGTVTAKRQGGTKAYNRIKHYRYKYGITVEYFNLMLKNQDGKCEICEIVMGDKVRVDHSHSTGKVRGLLCQRCNRQLSAIEIFGFVNKAQKYLKKYG